MTENACLSSFFLTPNIPRTELVAQYVAELITEEMAGAAHQIAAASVSNACCGRG